MKASFVLICLLLVAQFAYAEDNGRYHAIVFPKVTQLDADRVFILDTKEGHIWTWTLYPKVQGHEGGRYLSYQGKVRPGQKVGEILDRQPWGP